MTEGRETVVVTGLGATTPLGGDVKPGSPALLLGFGAGLCYAAQVVTVP